MPDLTDEELGTLLRETFADREARVGQALPHENHVPSAHMRRRAIPVLLAAATVLVVLTGTLYGVQRIPRTTTTQPAAAVSRTSTTYTTRDADIWGLAVGVMLRSFKNPQPKPAGFSRFTKAVVVDSSSAAPGRVRPGPQFSPNQRVMIVAHTIRLMPVRVLDRSLPDDVSCADYPETAIIQLSDVLDKGNYLEVDVALSMPTGCQGTTSARYRVEPRGAHWVITQNLGPWNR
ncbi:hypothetical protein ACQHIV_27760 [Kribbella sp. GL6]|uniref:hypothetical protein n=1 Tax=Kribbella sp. GL6 TaxID=3419765 RepID=UPI003D067F95